MRDLKKAVYIVSAGLLLATGGVVAVAAQQQDSFTVPVTYYKLPNGLRVILSRDTTAPTMVTAVYYRIGFRAEPKDRDSPTCSNT